MTANKAVADNCQSLPKGKTMGLKNRAWSWEMGLAIKRHKEILWNDETVLYLDCNMTYALVKTCGTH